jgi:hypothetical protein
MGMNYNQATSCALFDRRHPSSSYGDNADSFASASLPASEHSRFGMEFTA